MPGNELRQLPKVVLHDHLDGGLRAQTIIDLAGISGYDGLPANDAGELARWFLQGESGSLESYLTAFDHTVAVMQTSGALERIAYEAVVDLAEEGVVYAELRHAPTLSTAGGLDRTEVMESIVVGLTRGEQETGTVARLIAVALRNENDSKEVARAAVAMLGAGVVGFDLAGPEAGYPADLHIEACTICHEAGMAVTIHAGEGDGPESIRRARNHCGASRIGHGVRIIEDTRVVNGEIVSGGALARSIRDQQVPLELAVTSNLHTGLFPNPMSHPLGALARAGFAVTINTDNRLMSRTSMTAEFELAARYHRFDIPEFLAVTERAIVAGFAEWPVRQRILEEQIRPVYLKLL